MPDLESPADHSLSAGTAPRDRRLQDLRKPASSQKTLDHLLPFVDDAPMLNRFGSTGKWQGCNGRRPEVLLGAGPAGSHRVVPAKQDPLFAGEENGGPCFCRDDLAGYGETSCPLALPCVQSGRGLSAQGPCSPASIALRALAYQIPPPEGFAGRASPPFDHRSQGLRRSRRSTGATRSCGPCPSPASIALRA